MDGATESLVRDRLSRPPATARRRRPGRTGVRPPQPVLRPWLRAQSVNVTRHAAALRPFKREEFGTGGAAPSEGHIQAVNTLMTSLRRGLLELSQRVTEAVKAADAEPTTARLSEVVRRKDKAQHWVQGIERIWDFYFELFGQRQSNHADWLLSCDRIALDCYQAYWNGLGKARPIPAPPPFCYMRTGFAPATFRRGIPLRRLGKQINPFPIVQLPYHRLINPWTLGAMLHETSHNLQSELGLSRDIPRAMARALLEADQPKHVAGIWTRWNREMFADMSALLLGGPEVLGSLMDVVGRAPAAVFAYNPRGPHPTPYLRTLISVELLRRMGFVEEAERYRRAWIGIYPPPPAGAMPPGLLETFSTACRLAVDAMCFRPYASLGNKSLAQVVCFNEKDRQMSEEAAGRLAAGVDPGIVPARFLIAAARIAMDRKLARPGVIAKNFYVELARR
ncbi:MAG TPA: hypothetical protein VME47_12920 [Acetobacteraceae bacterium]|nr:hypothetical protein [Acetobacteraceae bacterium]